MTPRTHSAFREGRAACRAFTLTEVFVSIGIISFLAALLLPSVQGVRSRSQEAKCLSNLRQLQAANIAYANDHNGVFVPVSSGSTNWYSNLDFRSLLEASVVSELTALPKGLMCPGAVKNKIKIGYGYNWTGLPTSSAQKNDLSGATVRAARSVTVANPSKTIAFIDGLDWQVNCDNSAKYDGGTVIQGSDCAYRHNNGAQIAFWDGHAEFRLRKDIEKNTDLWTFLPQ